MSREGKKKSGADKRIFKLWRLFTSQWAFSSIGTSVIGTWLVYRLRIVERRYGSAKYAVSKQQMLSRMTNDVTERERRVGICVYYLYGFYYGSDKCSLGRFQINGRRAVSDSRHNL